MQRITIHPEFAAWREAARRCLANSIEPRELCWIEGAADSQVLPGLLTELITPEAPIQPSAAELKVPKSFVQIAAPVACHRDGGRWDLLYRVLWRLTHGEPRLMELIIDDDIHRMLMMEKAVRRDSHKMKAFVRFRKIESEGGEQFIAWHRPDHFILKRVAPFFADRFAPMHWTVLTPDASVDWDTHELTFGPGVPESEAPREDVLEEFWRTYYASIFNPARLKLKAMRKEMPKKYWATLPEAQLIPQLVHDAPRRVEEMMRKAQKEQSELLFGAAPAELAPGTHGKDTRPDTAAHDHGNVGKAKWTGSARDFLPSRLTLPQLIQAASACRGCDLYCHATQTVFGEGRGEGSVMFIGEQPGDQEDLAGKPFVGPAGRLLDECLGEAGIPRDELYVTNAVKHFKFEPRGNRRIHAKPSSREVSACRPWLEAEIQVIQPKMIVCLGATAAQSLLGSGFRVTQHRGEVIKNDWAPWLLATIHPSALLRIPDPALKETSIREFVDDLKLVATKMREG